MFRQKQLFLLPLWQCELLDIIAFSHDLTHSELLEKIIDDYWSSIRKSVPFGDRDYLEYLKGGDRQ
jgi:hypothetical protein